MHFKTDRKKESKGIMQWVYYLSSSSTATARVSVYHTHYYSTVIIIIIIIIIALSCELDVISFYI